MNDSHNNNNIIRNKIQEYLILILGIRIACSVEQQEKLMDIKDFFFFILLNNAIIIIIIESTRTCKNKN
jgi:hypothetical protein